MLSGFAATSENEFQKASSNVDEQEGTTNSWEVRALALKARLIVAVALGVPLMLLSMIPALQFSGWRLVGLLLAAPIITWCAWPFHRGAARAIRYFGFTMDTLVSLGIIVSTLWSLWVLVSGTNGHMYFESTAMITVFLLVGQYLEARSKFRAYDTLTALAQIAPNTAIRETEKDNTTEQIPVTDLHIGDTCLVAAGKQIPADGVVISGASTIDESMLTGESVPVAVTEGSAVTGGTMNGESELRIRVTATGKDTVFAQISRLVWDAQAGKAPIQRLADQVSGVFVPTVLSIALLTLIGWLLVTRDLPDAVTAAVSVLVVACPCALGLATPMALLVGTGRAWQQGILIRGPEVLETSRAVNVALFDKTGTLTSGKMKIQGIGSAPTFTAETVLNLAQLAESRSTHPIARAIREYRIPASDSGQPTAQLEAETIANAPGHGVIAELFNGGYVLAGGTEWLRDLGVNTKAIPTDGDSDGETVVTVAKAENITAAGAEPAPVTLTLACAPAKPITEQNKPNENPDYLEFSITGMSCAACVRRVERSLNKVPGANAEVNLVTESARVTGLDETATAELVTAVEHAGYGAKYLGHKTDISPRGINSGMLTWQRDDLQFTGTTVIGSIRLTDEIRPAAAQVIAWLRDTGIEPVIVSGDAPGPVRAVAETLGIKKWYARVLPADKRNIVSEYQEQGQRVLMVGDGINDAAALAQAGAGDENTRGLGVAIGAGTQVAIAAADITLIGDDIIGVPRALKLAAKTLRIIKENLGWAFGYNIIAIPLAVAGALNPMIAAAFMGASSVLVVTNSLRLKRA